MPSHTLDLTNNIAVGTNHMASAGRAARTEPPANPVSN